MRESWLNNPLRVTKIAVAGIDIGALALVVMIEVARTGMAHGAGASGTWLMPCVVFATVYPSVLYALGLYDHLEPAPQTRHPLTLILILAFWAVLVDLAIVGSSGSAAAMPHPLIIGAGIGGSLWLLRSLALRPSRFRRRVEGVLLLGWDRSVELLIEALQTHPYRRRSIIGILAAAEGDADESRQGPAGRIPVLRVEEAQNAMLRGAASVLAVPAGGALSGSARCLIRCRPRHVQVCDALAAYQGLVHRVPVTAVGDPALQSTARLREPRQGLACLALRRSMDIVVSELLLIALLPVMVLVAIGSLLLQGRPVIFSQERIGFSGRPFTIYKFRTMAVLSRPRAEIELMTSIGDVRLTQWGKLLRRSHLDELPQFWNVLRGDMALVGPRPISRALDERISRRMPYWTLRYLVRPGATGWEQVCSGDSRNETGHCERLERDLYYIENASILFDLYILLKTPGVLLRGRGAR